ncbi:Disheveled-associated activator of morphogenesis 2 [Talaromyces islandicus]|uniref:Disheveled-associated activator of morphogenesis 2 n=1 Tax=Talaromyces islandicus TaxID=28573 RepID=A0A0U1LNE6_TALIS|nr:Disheveled-associated activator of morphogenesis 2 [Talaromyces islandicus]
MGVDMPGPPGDKAWLDDAESEEHPRSSPNEAPVHPLSQLQGPFEESITEAANGSWGEWEVIIDAHSRRNEILTLPKYERLCGRRWRQKPGEKYHPLWKIVAQITFGLHLLVKDLAKSKVDVIKILQTHVSELDGFVERTTDDLHLARNDIKERFDLLRLPLDNMAVFVQMLDDPSFRQTVILDNDRIEHIIKRSAISMDDSLKDIKKGIESINGLAFYIKDVGKTSNDRPPDLNAVCVAMMGNVDGWNRELSRLKKSAYKLALGLTQLNRLSTEIQRLVGEASRKSLVIHDTPIPRRQSRIKFRIQSPRDGSPTMLEKPLPSYPEISDPPTAELHPPSILRTPSILRPGSRPALRERGPQLNQSTTPRTTIHTRKHNENDMGKVDYSNIPPKRQDTYIPYRPPQSSPAPSNLSKNSVSQNAEERNGRVTPSPKPLQDSFSPLKSFTKKSSKVKLGSNRLYRSASKTLLALSNVRNAPKVDSPPPTKNAPTEQPPNLSERSWIDFDNSKMSWSHGIEGFGETHTFVPTPDLPPEFPHLDFLALSDDDTASNDEGEDEMERNSDAGTNVSDEGTQVTALPSLGSFSANFDDPTSWFDDTAAEVASTYSVKSRKRRKRKSQEPPLPHTSIDALAKPDGDANPRPRQSRFLPGQKANLFSLRPKAGAGAPKPLTLDQNLYTVQPGWTFPRKSTSSLSPLSPTFPTSPTINEMPDSPPISPGTPFSPMYLAQISRLSTNSDVPPEGPSHLSAPTSPSPYLTVSGVTSPRSNGNGDISGDEADKAARRLLKPNLKKFASSASLNQNLQVPKPELPTGRVYSNPMLAGR